MSAKQDRQGVRTASNLEQKYNFGETFNRVIGISNDTRMYVEKAESELRSEFNSQIKKISGDIASAEEQVLQIQNDLEAVEGDLEKQGENWQSEKDNITQAIDGLTERIGDVSDQIVSVDGNLQKIAEKLENHFAFTTSGLHIKAESNGVGIGKEPAKADTLEVGVNAEFEQSLVRKGNVYSFQPEAVDGVQGYILLAVITLTAENVDAPIVFKINRRDGLCPMTVYARFASASTTTDPDLGSFTYEGDNFGAFMVKSATSTWKLYVDNTAGWTGPCLQEWYTTEDQMSGISVAFQDECVEGTDPSVLGTCYRATPAKKQSILDFIYPVDSIYLSHSHTSPETLFGGTWERIEDALLWAAASDDAVGQVGNTSVTADGSGLAYIQISAWRRTA